MVSIDEVLQLAIELGASDVHFTVGVPPILRVNGRLMATNYPVLTP